MNLIEIYIQEVTRRLPEKNREDIALELRSTIEDMLPDDYGEENVKAVLEKLGNPVVLASGYRDRPMHLIGPRYYDLYVTLLKMTLPIAGVIAMISMFASYFFSYNGEEAYLTVILTILGKGVWVLIEVVLQVFFWATLTFAIIERADKGKDREPLTMKYTKWTPDDLKNITYIPKKRSILKGEVFFALIWTAIWTTVYFYADHLAGVYENNGDGLVFVTPALNQNVLFSYWPMVVIVVSLEIALALYKLIKGQWTKRMAICNAVLQLIGTIVFIVILRNPNIMTQDFITYMSDLFTITANQFKTWIIGGGIFFYMLSAAINVIDGFRKARNR